MARRVHTEVPHALINADAQRYMQPDYGDEHEPYDINALSDDDNEDAYGVEEDDDVDEDREATGEVAKQQHQNDDDANDLANYKGIYFNDDQGEKYTDPENGAHFEFNDMCRRLHRILQKR